MAFIEPRDHVEITASGHCLKPGAQKKTSATMIKWMDVRNEGKSSNILHGSEFVILPFLKKK